MHSLKFTPTEIFNVHHAWIAIAMTNSGVGCISRVHMDSQLPIDNTVTSYLAIML